MARKIANEWLKAAKDDLEVIEEIIDNPNLTHMVAFHAQQAIEKSFKALLEEYKIQTPKIHSLKKLLGLLKDNDINIDNIFNNDILLLLDELYIEARYPGELGLLPHGKPTINEAKKFYDFAKRVFDLIFKKVNK